MMTQHTGDGLFHGLIGDDLALLGGYTAEVYLTTMTEGHTLRTIAFVMMSLTGRSAAYEPLELEVVERLEEVLVVHLKRTVLQSLVGDPDVLIVVTHLMGMGIQSAVGGDDTVAVEVMVAGRIAAVVATIGKDFLTRGRILVAQALVYEVPDITTLVLGVLADDVPVLLETTHGVTHGVGILALDERTGIIGLGILLAVLITHVHGTEDVGLAIMTGLLELAGTGLIVSLHPVVSLLEVRTITGLVAE